jgi:hypothetical protein
MTKSSCYFLLLSQEKEEDFDWRRISLASVQEQRSLDDYPADARLLTAKALSGDELFHLMGGIAEPLNPYLQTPSGDLAAPFAIMVREDGMLKALPKSIAVASPVARNVISVRRRF